MLEVARYPAMKFGYLPRDRSCGEKKYAKGIESKIWAVSCHNRTVTVEKKIYRSIVDLLQAHPTIKDDLMKLARAVNFFANGCDFTVITEPKEFKNTYEQIIDELSSSDEDLSNPLFDDLIGAGIRETKKISIPHYRKDGKFVFYAEKSFVPYRVICEFSSDTNTLPKIRCDMLELKKLNATPKKRALTKPKT